MSYARSAVTRMTLDMSRLDLQRSETVTQGDTNRRWEVTLINGGAPFRLPPNWTAALTGTKPDGTGLLNGCSVADGKIIYDFATGEEIATCAGSYPVQFDIWDEVGELVASPKVYVNVLADVRPHEELKSDGQYTQIGNLIGKVNQIDADVDRLAEKMLTQGDDITALKEKVTTAGTVTIPASEWTDTLPKLAFPEQPVLAKGTVALLMPGNTASQIAARKAKITVQSDPYGDGKIVVQREDGDAPTGNITLDYLIIKVDNPEASPKAALIGVDAYGEEGGTASGVDEAAVKSIIKQVMPVWTQAETPPSETDPTISDWAKAKTKPTYTATEVGLGKVDNVRQYSANNPPPYPVTSVNGQVGSVNLPIPSEAADVGADPVGTAEAKLKTHNTDNDAHEYIQQRIDALRTLIENFLDIDDESFDQLSEILRNIRANTSALELLGTNKVDKTAISTSMTDSNPEHVASMTLIVALDNALTVVEQAIENLKTNKQTAEQVYAAINNALSGYLTSVKAAELYQPKGDYLTPGVGDARYAKPSDIPTVPQTLPNPYALTILGKTYTGGKAVSLTAEELMEAIKTASGGVVAYLDGNRLVLSGNLPDATYTAYYEVNGELIEIGDLTLGAVTPDPVTYTVTFVADGVTVDTVEYQKGDTALERVPDVPAKEGYTGVWEAYDITNGGNITVNAVYTQIPVEPDPDPIKPKNFATPSAWVQKGRIRSNGEVATDAAETAYATDFIPCQNGDVIYINNAETNHNLYHGAYSSSKGVLGASAYNGTNNYFVFSDVTNTSATVTIKYSGVAYMRFTLGNITDTKKVVINIKRNGEWLTE